MRYNADKSVSDEEWKNSLLHAQERAQAWGQEKMQHDQDVARMKVEQMAQRLAQTEGWSPLQGQLGHATGIPGSLLQQQAQQAQPPKRPAELPIALNELNTLACNLMNVLVDLEKRLQPVMRSAPPETKQANGNVDQGSRTQLGSMVYQASHTIDLAVNRVRDLLDRLEL